MNNVISQRFKYGSPPPNIAPVPIPVAHEDLPQEVDNSAIITPEVLRDKLKEKLNPQPQIIEAAPSSIPNPVRLELVHFATLYEFVHWYENNKTLFSEKQQQPLNTLVEARNITTTGCNCDKNKRKLMAEDYFKNFWIRNKGTDLLPTLQKNLNTKKLLIGNFIAFPE